MRVRDRQTKERACVCERESEQMMKMNRESGRDRERVRSVFDFWTLPVRLFVCSSVCPSVLAEKLHSIVHSFLVTRREARSSVGFDRTEK